MTDLYHGDPIHSPIQPSLLLNFPNDNTKVLKGDGSWGASGGGATVTSQIIPLASTFSSSSSTYVDITGMTVTLPNRAGGYALVTFIVYWNNATQANDVFRIQVMDNGVAMTNTEVWAGEGQTFLDNVTTITYATQLNGQVVKLQFKGDGGHSTSIKGGGPLSSINTLEIS